ncbi:MAG: hypothetical protein PHQ75_08655 [Thermoguttaceae bacterium]|nr:hypothetical protein [Thermoguttaceae bacterium]
MKPFSAELKIAFAVVTLFLGWLLAIMIPESATTARDWVVRKSGPGDTASKTWYLDGQGTLLGAVPKAEGETDFAQKVQVREKEVESQVKSSAQISSQAGNGFAVFDPKTKTIAGNKVASREPGNSKTKQSTASKTADASGKSSAKPSASPDSMVASDSLESDATPWQTVDKGGLEKQQWAEEVKAVIPNNPVVEPRPIPRWDDPVAKAPPLGKPSSSEAPAAIAQQDGKKAGSSPKSDQVATNNKVAQSDDTKKQPAASANRSSESDLVIKQNDKLADAPAVSGPAVSGPAASGSPEAFTPIVIAKNEKPSQKVSTKVKAPAPLSIASAKPGSGKSGTGNSSEKIAVVQPLAAAPSPVSSPSRLANSRLANSSLGNVQTPQSIAASSPLMVDPGYSGKAWVPPRTSQAASASLIRTEIPQGSPTIIPTNYSTPISKTVSRLPAEVRFDELGEERRHEPSALRNTASRPNSPAPNSTGLVSVPSGASAIALPSSMQTVRVVDTTTPVDFARSRSMDQARYTRFYEYNKHKLDSSGYFPAKTLLFVPD